MRDEPRDEPRVERRVHLERSARRPELERVPHRPERRVRVRERAAEAAVATIQRRRAQLHRHPDAKAKRVKKSAGNRRLHRAGPVVRALRGVVPREEAKRRAVERRGEGRGVARRRRNFFSAASPGSRRAPPVPPEQRSELVEVRLVHLHANRPVGKADLRAVRRRPAPGRRRVDALDGDGAARVVFSRRRLWTSGRVRDRRRLGSTRARTAPWPSARRARAPSPRRARFVRRGPRRGVCA